ncbi:methylenetetrahydrofolate reductase [NAD(P)H] [Aquicella lusitana]|uniref:Methylenetetrahydrofolate reductase n=1 Tax=Aquicella lusitana TaxID=254246 RepID=A0A370GPG4_9COXI|nr:methylenetetrahydrofolate reductase [NAD(P)H] [Aquicella lusitana]RDI45136.1 5,10-methylenetetrahydrofolate reductase (NAD(P)) [Aquicella lusitana]VVC72794.1 5,10-methylenetetrahydrofolate reductase [Aquicella lusitana]
MNVISSQNISFEFFPPKTDEGESQLQDTAIRLAEYHPHFFSMTFGAGGSTRAGTIEMVKMLQGKTSVPVAPHLACIGSSREEMVGVIRQYQDLKVRRIVALRGDLPSGMVQPGEFRYASELVALIRETAGDFFHIEVAAYPEIHPQAKSVEDDILNLKRKYEAGASSAITQYFFNPDAYFYYLDECAKHSIYMPIVPGIMPITQFSRLVRFSEMCGAEIPCWIRKRLESYGDDMESIKAFGFEVVFHLCQTLIAGGAPGLHFYTLNKSEATLKILENLNISIHRPNLPRYVASQKIG